MYCNSDNQKICFSSIRSNFCPVHSNDNPLQALARTNDGPSTGSRRSRRWSSRRSRRSKSTQGPALLHLLEHGLRLGWRHPLSPSICCLDSPQQDHALQPHLRHDRVAARGLRGLNLLYRLPILPLATTPSWRHGSFLDPGRTRGDAVMSRFVRQMLVSFLFHRAVDGAGVKYVGILCRGVWESCFYRPVMNNML